MDIESAIDGLFRVPLGDFVGARNALAKSLKKVDKAAAERISALAKPSASAWAINQLHWGQRAVLDALFDAARAVRDVHSAALGGALPGGLDAAKRARRSALEAAVAAAERVLHEGGQAVSAALSKRLGATLDALAAYGGEAPDAVPGRMQSDVDAPGFDALAALTAGGAPISATTPAPVAATGVSPAPTTEIPAPPKPPPVVAPVEAESRTAAERLGAARERLSKARQIARERRAKLDDAADAHEEHHRRLSEARQARQKAAQAAIAVAERVEALRRELEAAQAESREAERARVRAEAALGEAAAALSASEAALQEARGLSAAADAEVATAERERDDLAKGAAG